MQGAILQGVPAVLDGGEKRIVHGGEGQDLAALFHQSFQGEIDAGHHATGHEHPIGIGLPAVAALPPALNGLEGGGKGVGIAEHRVLAALFQRVHHGGRRGKVRVGDPERQKAVLLTEAVLEVPLDAGGPSAVYELVKSVHLNRSFLYLPGG